MSKHMLRKRSWQEFRDAGLIWYVNRFLHIFGWAICCEVDSAGEIVDVYPALCRFRGFDEKSETEGFEKLTHHIRDRADQLIDDLDVTDKGN